MEHQEKWQPQIDRYLKHLMSEEEKNVFMEQVKNNADLAKELDLQQDLLAGVRTLGNRSLKAKLKNMHSDVITENVQSPNKIRRLLVWTISAAAAVLLLFFIFNITNQSVINSSELFAQYYQPYELNSQSRNGGTSIQLIEATELYKQKKYAEVIPLFNEILKTQPENTNIQLAAGIAHLSLNQTGQALSYFKNIQILGDPFLEDRAQWYLALSYLKSEQIELCKRQVANILQIANHDYAKEALALSKDLEK